MFRMKICGVTNPDDGRMVVRAGADAVGLNFYPPSPRYLELDRAAEVAEAIGSAAVKVGLFVNAPRETIEKTLDRVPLDALQIHGDEPPEFLAELHDAIRLPIVRAFRLGPDGLAPVVDYLDPMPRA